MVHKTDKDRDKMYKLFENAGMNELQCSQTEVMIAIITSVLARIMEANKDTAQNYMAFCLDTPAGAEYELTIKKLVGKSAAQQLGELKDTLSQLGGSDE